MAVLEEHLEQLQWFLDLIIKMIYYSVDLDLVVFGSGHETVGIHINKGFF